MAELEVGGGVREGGRGGGGGGLYWPIMGWGAAG